MRTIVDKDVFEVGRPFGANLSKWAHVHYRRAITINAEYLKKATNDTNGFLFGEVLFPSNDPPDNNSIKFPTRLGGTEYSFSLWSSFGMI